MEERTARQAYNEGLEAIKRDILRMAYYIQHDPIVEPNWANVGDLSRIHQHLEKTLFLVSDGKEGKLE